MGAISSCNINIPGQKILIMNVMKMIQNIIKILICPFLTPGSSLGLWHVLPLLFCNKITKLQTTQQLVKLEKNETPIWNIEMKVITRCKVTIISESAICKKFLGHIVSYPASL
jgi:hypothetical protein